MVAGRRQLIGILLLLCLSGCDDGEPPGELQNPEALMAAEPQQKTISYVCDNGSHLQARHEPRFDRLVLFLPDRAVRLEPARSANGRQYRADGIVFRHKGDHARLERGNQPAIECRQLDEDNT